MSVIPIQRVADSAGVLHPAQRAIQFGSGLSVTDHPNDTLVGVNGDGQVTGYLAITASIPPGAATVKDAPYNAVGDGVADDFTAVHSAFAAASDFFYPVGTYRMRTTGTIGAASSMHRFVSGGKLSVDTGVVTTIRGTIEAGRYQIFSGVGTVLLPDMPEAPPEWWGGIADGTTDSTLAFQAAIGSMSAAGGRVHVTKGTYVLSGILAIPSNVLVEGDGWGCILKCTATRCLDFVSVSNAGAKNLAIDLVDGTIPRVGVSIRGGSSDITIEKCHIKNAGFFSVLASGDPLTVVGITNAVTGTGGQIRLTAVGHGLANGNTCVVDGITAGTTEAVGGWFVSVIDANTVELVGSVFVNAYTSGGTIGQTHGGGGGIRILHNTLVQTTCLIANGPDVLECFPQGGPGYLADPGIIVEGNIIIGSPGNCYNGIKVQSQRGARIIGNHVQNISSSNNEGGINGGGSSRGTVISNNVIRNCGVGITANGQPGRDNGIISEDIKIHDNVIEDCNVGHIFSPQGFRGLSVQGNSVTLVDLDIQSSTNTSPIQVKTYEPHGLAVSDFVVIAGHLVNTNANGTWQVAAVIDPYTFTLFTSTGNGTGGATGQAQRGTAQVGVWLDNTTLNIISSTNASPIVLNVTGVGHTFYPNQKVVVSGHLVNTNANGTWRVGKIDDNHIALLGSTGNGVGAATGTVGSPPYDDLQIVGNRLRNCNIEALPSCPRAVVSNNSVIGGATGINGVCIDVGGNDVSVSDNYVERSSYHGIRVIGDRSRIVGNKIVDVNTGNTGGGVGAGGACIAAWGNNVQILGNHGENVTSAGKAYAGIDLGVAATSGLSMRDNRFVNMQTEEVASNAPTAPNQRHQDCYADGTTANLTADGTEHTLKSYVIPQGAIGLQGGFRVFASGSVGGANGNKTLRIYAGDPSSAVAAVTIIVANNGDWEIDAIWLAGGGESFQQMVIRIWVNGIVVLAESNRNANWNTSSNPTTVKVTGVAVAGDTFSQDLFLVERIR